MNPETINQLKEVFTPVANKIGQGAEFGWEVVVKQQIAYGMISIFVVVVGIFVGIFAYKVFKKCNKETDNDIIVELCLVISTVSAIISFLLILFGFINGILYLFNPHYYAIRFFLDLVK